MQQVAAGQQPYCCPPCRAGRCWPLVPLQLQCSSRGGCAWVLLQGSAGLLAHLRVLLLCWPLLRQLPSGCPCLTTGFLSSTVFESEHDYLEHQGTSAHQLVCRQVFRAYSGGRQATLRGDLLASADCAWHGQQLSACSPSLLETPLCGRGPLCITFWPAGSSRANQIRLLPASWLVLSLAPSFSGGVPCRQ